MGINCLFPFIKSYSSKVNITSFSGKTAAVDASCFIHKALAVSISRTGDRTRFVQIFSSYVKVLKDSGVVPFMVFDGLPLQAKEKETARRKSERQARLEEAQKLEISDTKRNKLLSQSVEKTYEDVVECIKHKYADIAITEDADLLVYGCEKVVVKLSLNGEGEYFELNQVLGGLKVTMHQFVHGCIAAGCDYLKNVNGIGINKAFTFVKSGQLFTQLKRKGAPDSYERLFAKALAVFMHQTVFDPTKLEVQPLAKWDEEPDKPLQDYCGAILDKQYANDLAAGNVNMKNGNNQHNFSCLQMISVTKAAIDTLYTDHGTELNVTITNIDSTWFSWRIPCFPVMSVDFTKVKIEINGKSLNGLIKRGLDISPVKVKCTSHCQVEIDAMDYTVIWEFSNCQAADQHEVTAQVAAVSNNNPSPDSDESYESDTEVQHSLPFKVLGTCHSSYRQDALEEAYSCLNEYNRPVFVKLEHEEDNTYDSNAIAVFVQVDYEYKKVGYIASELKKFVHPHLTNPCFDVSVKHIRFCTNFWMVGYYITIELSKKGLWNKEVVKASKRVK